MPNNPKPGAKTDSWEMIKMAPKVGLGGEFYPRWAQDQIHDGVAGRITHGVTAIVQGSDDAVAAPSRIFFDQLDEKLFELRIQERPTELV